MVGRRTPGGGYMGKVLRINLTQGSFVEEEIDPQILYDYIGGIGLGARLLYDEVPPEISPLDAENRLIFLTGPLTGTTVPGSGGFAVISKSPITGFVCCGQANGHFGARLKKAGYDGLIFTGKSEKLVYLYINNGKPEIKDACALQSKTTWETREFLLDAHNAQGRPLSVASIGPSGEKRVAYAAIMSDFGHVAATGGAGAVMGSKNLKAIAVHGKAQIPLDDKHKGLVRELTRAWAKRAMTSTPIAKGGTQALFMPYYESGWVPVKNLTTNIFPEAKKFDGTHLRENVFTKVKKTPCHACTFNHCRAIRSKDEHENGQVWEDPEYEDLAGWGPNVGITDPKAAAYLTHMNDGWGMDLKECSFTLSLAMECFEKGLISREDTGGIDLAWGNTESILQLLEQIATRRGFGAVLADGVKKAAERIGGEAPQYAVYAKRGIAPHVHDPRARWGTLFAEALSDTGSIDGIDYTTRKNDELGIHEPTSDPDDKVARAQARSGPLRHLEDSIINCFFFDRAPGILNIMVEVLNAVAGYDYKVEEFLKCGDRITNLLRTYNIREGLVPDDDTLSPRLLKAPQDGPQKGKSFAETFLTVRSCYYREKGWDAATGKPLPETLRELGLEDLIKDIW